MSGEMNGRATRDDEYHSTPIASFWSNYRGNRSPVPARLFGKPKKPYDWEDLESPQYVDFSSTPIASESFFERKTSDDPHAANPEKQVLPGVSQEDDCDDIARYSSGKAIPPPPPSSVLEILLNYIKILKCLDDVMLEFLCDITERRFKGVALSEVKRKPRELPESPRNNEVTSSSTEQSSVAGNQFKHSKSEKCKRRPLDQNRCTVVCPFSFEAREKIREERRRAQTNKELEQRNQTWQFHANPVPKFLKVNPVAKCKVSTAPRVHSIDDEAKAWIPNQQPFKPKLPRKTLVPKSPTLHTAIRAKERERFENYMREKEEQFEAMNRTEAALRKTREAEITALLRKQTIHRAQPVPSFKVNLPQVAKRPLTEPMTPLFMKRRRRF